MQIISYSIEFLTSRITKKLLTSLLYVYTIVYIMATSTATVIKTGNSYALRVPKSYAERNNLRPGAKVILQDPQISGGTLADLQASIKNSRNKGGITVWDKITNPSEWQQAERDNWN